MRWHVKPGMKVGIAGIDGLGHMAVKIMQGEITYLYLTLTIKVIVNQFV